MDLNTKVVDIYQCRLMKIVPIEFRMQCRNSNPDRHDHDYQSIIRLTDDTTKITLPVRFTYFNHRGSKMHKMCNYLSKKKSTFSDDVSMIMEKKSLRKGIKVDKDLFDYMKSEFIKENSTDDIAKQSERDQKCDDIIENIILNTMNEPPEIPNILQDHNYENLHENEIENLNAEPMVGTSRSFYGDELQNASLIVVGIQNENPEILPEIVDVNPNIIEEENIGLKEKIDNVSEMNNDDLNLQNENQNLIVENNPSIEIAVADRYSDITVDDIDWDLFADINLNGNIDSYDINLNVFDQIEDNVNLNDSNVNVIQPENNDDHVVNNDVLMNEANINHEDMEFDPDAVLNDLFNIVTQDDAITNGFHYD